MREYIPIITIPSGGKPRLRFERFGKNVVFAIAKILIFSLKIIEFSQGKSSGFNMFACNLQGFLCWNLAGCFFVCQLSMRLCNMRPVFSKTFSLELCQRHCQILMLRINLGLTWPFTLVARLHGMADLDSLHIASTPPVWIRILLFLILFLMQKNPLEWLQASWRQPNLALNDG